MNIGNDKVIGIVGGMGPQAGLTLFNNILCLTGAITDQQHISTMLMSFPRHIADRTAYLDGEVSTNPAFGIAEVIKKLDNAGAHIVGIACNTAHAPRIFDVIVNELANSNSSVQLLHMPVETCKFIHANHPEVLRIGLMTSNGTYKSGVYFNLLQQMGYEVIIPGYEFQNEVIHKMIYDREFGLKSNPDTVTAGVKQLLKKAILFFKQKNADAIIIGCTELSLVINYCTEENMLIIDSTRSLAKALVRETLYVELSFGKKQFVSH